MTGSFIITQWNDGRKVGEKICVVTEKTLNDEVRLARRNISHG